MGSGQSRVDKAEARRLAGDSWDEELFNSLAIDAKGTVSRKALKKLQKASKKDNANASRKQSVHSIRHTSAEINSTEQQTEQQMVAPSDDIQEPDRQVTTPVPLATRFGAHIVSKGTRDLLADIGGKERVVAMVTRFYDKAFEDQHLDRFIARHDDPHGERLGLWIAEKMGDPDGEVWTSTRPQNARVLAHRDAWHSPKREPEKHGRRFKLDDCRVWMRLMFWACRDEGLMDHPAFGDWFVQFIGHFIAVYELNAPPYAQESADWSLSEANIQTYRDNNNLMKDVIGVGVTSY